MKLREKKRLSLIATLAAASILLCSPVAVAQKSGTENGAAGDGAAADLSKLITPKQQAGALRGPFQPVCENLTATAGTGSILLPVNFVPSIESRTFKTTHAGVLGAVGSIKGRGQLQDETPASLAKKLRNPVSPLRRIASRTSYDLFLAADREGWRLINHFEPVIPIALSQNWNLISRTTLPVIQQDGLVESSTQTGLGDTIQSLYLSPNGTEPLFWGIGPAVQIPTATNTMLGTGKLGLGPALAIGKQHDAWTYGALGRHIWSVAGHSDRANVSSTFIQPFIAYTTRSGWTYSIDSEATYDWVNKQASIPVHVEVAKVLRVGRRPVSIGGALRCWAATVPGGPQACGVRFIVTPLFPSK